MKFHGFSLISMENHRVPWIFMDFHGFWGTGFVIGCPPVAPCARLWRDCTSPSNKKSPGRLDAWMLGCLDAWMLAGLLAGLLACWLAGLLAGLLAGWLAGD